MKYGFLFVLLLAPVLALGAADLPAQAGPQTLELSAKAQVEGSTVPLGVVVSTENTNVVLSAAKKEGATPVTFTLYVTPKPKPAPVAASTSAAAAVESSAKIQEGLAGISPAVAEATAPFFRMVDGGRGALSDVIDTQIANTKNNLNTGSALGAETFKNAGSNPGGTLWTIIQTLYLYLLTLLNFIIGSAAIFYPVAAILILYLLWRLVTHSRRPSYQ